MLVVAPGFDDVDVVDFGAVDVVDLGTVDVDDRVVDVDLGAEVVVVARGRVVVVVRSVVGVGPDGTIPFDDADSGRTSR